MNINYLVLTIGTMISSSALIISILDFSMWMLYVPLMIVGFTTAMIPSIIDLTEFTTTKYPRGNPQ